MSASPSSIPAAIAGNASSKRLALLVLGGGALFAALWYAAPQPEAVVEPVSSAGSARTPGSAATPAATARPEASSPGFATRGAARKAADLFASHSWYIPPPPPPPPPPAAPVAPTAPPLPYTFLGSYVKSGDKPVFFLVRGDRVHDVRPGDTLENTYAVGNVSRGQLQLTYLPLKQDQWLSVGSPL